MKKLLIILTILTISTQSALGFYIDVTPETPYANEIQTLNKNNKLPTNDKQRFHPTSKLNIINLLNLLFAFTQTELTTEISAEIQKLNENELSKQIIQTAIDNNLLSNYNFKNLHKSVSKSQALRLTFDATGIGTNKLSQRDKNLFMDLKTTSQTFPLAQKAYQIGIFENNKHWFSFAKRIDNATYAHYLYKIDQYLSKNNGGEQFSYTSSIPTQTINLNAGKTYSKTEQELINSNEFAVMLEVWNNLHTNFLYKDTLDNKTIVLGAIEGMTQQIEDPYTNFKLPSDADEFMTSLSSKYIGVGMALEIINNRPVVLSTFKDSPAEKAGLLPKDIIIEINDLDTSTMDIYTAISHIKGKEGTSIKLKFKRGSKTYIKDVTREVIIYKNVQWAEIGSTNNKIAHISISSFGQDSYTEFKKVADEINKLKIKKIILDLRNNTGGYTDQAINIISMFTSDKKTAVKFEYANGRIEEHRTTGNGALNDVDLVILVNGSSASASEIVAGALHDYKRAKLIGETTFGKGSVQEVIEYTTGGLLKYTIAHWLTPKNTLIDKTGITPDIEVQNSKTEDLQLKRAVEEIK